MSDAEKSRELTYQDTRAYWEALGKFASLQELQKKVQTCGTMGRA
jgi:hypothetical protein